MLCNKWIKRIVVIITLGIFMPGLQISAQLTTDKLYRQTSEMADMMIQYAADKESILRFYSTGSQAEGQIQQRGSDYNSPERRQRLLQLINDYKKQMEQADF